MEEIKYTIGQMARICNVTKKQLRYYDEKYILIPAYKDPKTNYRYYTEKQIEEVLFVKELKQINFSLSEISEALDTRELLSLKSKLMERRKNLKAQIDQLNEEYEHTIQFLLRVANSISLQGGGKNVDGEDAGIEVVDFPKRLVVSTRAVSRWYADLLFIGRRAELYQLAEENGLIRTAPLLAVFHGDYLKQFSPLEEDHYGDLELCVQVDKPGKCQSCKMFGGFKAVTALHLGHYREMKPLYEKMKDWARRNEYEVEDYSIEEYLSGVTLTQLQDEYVTRIYLPIKDKEKTN